MCVSNSEQTSYGLDLYKQNIKMGALATIVIYELILILFVAPLKMQLLV